MTLRKFKIATPERERELSEKYRVYRVREDPKTKYRYVTEILNIEEGWREPGWEGRRKSPRNFRPC